MSTQRLKPEANIAKVFKAIGEWISECERVPLAEGESSHLTIAVTHEPGGLAWTSARGFAQRARQEQPPAARTVRCIFSSLTQSQRWWLLHAQRKGYDHGFVAAPTRALAALEKLRLIEREPGTSRADTHWRVTDAGLTVHPSRRGRSRSKRSL